MWEYTIHLFKEYMGTGLIIGWFLLSAGYLWFTEKQKHIRILFIYVPLILLILFFTPVFANIVYYFVGDEIYYRILWLIPVTVVIAYAAVRIYGTLKSRIRILFPVAAGLLIIYSGSFIYSNPYFNKADNIYHMPQAVVDICDAIEVEGREVMAVFPVEMLQYVRQYSPVVCMPYGREITVERWGNTDELFAVMESEIIDAQGLARYAKARLCHYIILSQDKEIAGDLLSYDYILFDCIGGYDIYLDTTVYIGF